FIVCDDECGFSLGCVLARTREAAGRSRVFQQQVTGGSFRSRLGYQRSGPSGCGGQQELDGAALGNGWASSSSPRSSRSRERAAARTVLCASPARSSRVSLEALGFSAT